MEHSKSYGSIKEIIELEKMRISRKNSESIKNRLLVYTNAADLTDDEKSELISDINALGEVRKSFIKRPISAIQKLAGVSKEIKVAAGVVLLGSLAAGVIGCAASKKDSSNIDAVAIADAVAIEGTIDLENQKVDFQDVQNSNAQIDEMSEESKIMIERVSNSMNTALASGIEIIEDDKEDKDHVNTKTNMTRLFTNYYNVVNMDQISDLQWGAMYQDKMISTPDLENDFYALNVYIKQQMVSANSDHVYDFSQLYMNKEEAEILNNFAKMFGRMNDTTGNDRKQVAKEVYDYLVEILEYSSETQSKVKNYSPMMFETILTMSEVFDELTHDSKYEKGMYLDNELEASINRGIVACFSQNNGSELETQDKISGSTNRNYKDIIRIKMLEKLDSKILAASNAVQNNTLAGKSLSKLDSIDNIRKQIISNIDLSKYVAIQPYYDKLAELGRINEGASIHSNDSMVSNGQGGHSSKSHMESVGVDPNSPDAEQKYENAVEEKFEEDNPPVSVNNDGNTADPELLSYWAQRGSQDALAGNGKDSGVPSLYSDAYNQAYDAVIKSMNDAKNDSQVSEDHIEADGKEETDTSYDGTDYLPDNGISNGDNTTNGDSNNNNSGNSEEDVEFVPIDGETTETTDEEFYDFQTSLENLRAVSSLLAEYNNENSVGTSYTKTKV